MEVWVYTCVCTCGSGWGVWVAEGALPAIGTLGRPLQESTAGWSGSFPIACPGHGAGLASGETHPHVTSSLLFSFPVGPELAVPGKQKQDFSPGGLGRGGWEHGMHAGPCLQTLQENAGCLGQEGFLEIFSSSESISTSKLKAFDGWQASFCGRLPAGTGKGVGAKVTVLRWLLAGREVSLALLRPVVSNIDSTPRSSLCQTWEG